MIIVLYKICSLRTDSEDCSELGSSAGRRDQEQKETLRRERCMAVDQL